jgi:WD40 repeat protein
MTTLITLPNEILSLVTNHLEHPRDVLHLSLVSRRLSEFARLDGWKAYLKGRFGLAGLDPDARNSVHGLTTLYHNWQRKGFIARYLEPSIMTTNINTWQRTRWRGPRGQTMGYQPSIDSYEETFGAWSGRREVLAWSAGTQILMRVKETGKSARQAREDYDPEEDTTQTFDAFGHHSTWWTYKIPDSFEGRDDITSMKLLRPNQHSDTFEQAVYGTASGRLSLLSWDTQLEETREQQYDTGDRAVGFVSLSTSSQPMLAASLGDTTLALYPIRHNSITQDPVEPFAQTTPILPGTKGRIWSCNFLSHHKVAIGLGPSYEPIQIYDVHPGGLLSQPLRTFSLESKFWKGSRSDTNVPRNTSIYPILPIPGTAQSGSDAGNVFLSGGYDGITRLHDLRSPRGFETMFWDPTNDSSIYSLAMQGLERIVVGVSMHSMIKVFDLRLARSHAYQSISLPSNVAPKSRAKTQDYAYNAIVNEEQDHTQTVSGGWNLYLNPRVRPKRDAYREDYWRGGHDSPVYSLSIPSPTSPNVYAGLEGTVQSLTFHSVADPYPDPVLAGSITRSSESGLVDINSSYDPHGDALNLGMYEQGTQEGLGMQLLVQGNVDAGVVNKERKDSSSAKGLDERWMDIRNEGNRWARGEVPPAQSQGQGQGQGQGRGRGRGRGHNRGRGGRGRGRGSRGGQA